MTFIRATRAVVYDAFDGFFRDDCPTHAAGLAFYTLFSLAPLIVIVMKLTALLVDPDTIAAYLVTQAGLLVGQAGAEQVRAILDSSASALDQGRWPSVVSGALAVVGATTVLVQLQRSLNHVWRVEPRPGLNLGRFVLKRLISLAMMAIIAFLLVVSLFASAILGAASGWLSGWLPPWLGDPSSTAIDLGVSFAVFAGVFSSMFKFLPDRAISWHQVIVGGFVTSALFVIGKLLIGQYLGSSAVATFYGAAGSLAVVLVWVYYTAILVLLGAELTRAWTAWRGERAAPEPHAVDEAAA
ncbi:MAG: YihY/virulence factor BrkB family protein [Myxococcota bacterium]